MKKLLLTGILALSASMLPVLNAQSTNGRGRGGSAGPSPSTLYYFNEFLDSTGTSCANIGSPTSPTCTTYTSNLSANHPGQFDVAAGTGGSGTGEAAYQGSNTFVINTSPGFTWQTDVQVTALPGTTSSSYQVGIANAVAVMPWTTGAEFILCSTALCASNTVQNDWYCRYGSTQTDSGVAAVANTWTVLAMVSDGTTMHWYINGTEATACATAISNLPSSGQVTSAFATVAGSTTNVAMLVDYASLSRQVVR